MFDLAAMLGERIFGKRLPKESKQSVIKTAEPDPHIPCIECGAGIHRVAVAPDGRVSPCLQMRGLVAGWLTQEKLENIWENSEIFAFFRQKENVESHICKKCEDWEQCRGGCKVRAGLYGGKLAYPDLWSCATYGHVRRAKRQFSKISKYSGSFRNMVDAS
jgi:radical SAM protein with 4Fe4S-binding SPASM domain